MSGERDNDDPVFFPGGDSVLIEWQVGQAVHWQSHRIALDLNQLQSLCILDDRRGGAQKCGPAPLKRRGGFTDYIFSGLLLTVFSAVYRYCIGELKRIIVC